MSTTSDRLGKQAKEVTENFQEMGDTVRDAARKKLGQVGEKAAEYYDQGREKAHEAACACEQLLRERPLYDSLDCGRHWLAAWSLLETPLRGDQRMTSSDQFVRSAWMLASIAVVVTALYMAKGVLVPLTLAVLLSFLLSPVCDWFERHWLGRVPAVLLTAILGFGVLGIAAWTAVVQMTDLAPKMPEYQENLQAKLHSVNSYFIAALNKVTKTAEDVGQNLPQAAPALTPQGTDEWPYSVRILSSPMSPLQVLGGTFGTMLEGLGSAGIVIVLVVFFLVRREDLRDRFIRLVGQGQVTLTTNMLGDAAKRVSRFLSMLFIVNFTFGFVVGIGLYLIGIPNAILWGDNGRHIEIHSLYRSVDCRRCAGLSGDGYLDWLDGAISYAWAVYDPGTFLRECFGTVALWQGHGRVSRGGPSGGCLLDMVVGNCRTAAGDPVDRVPVGNRQARSAIVIFGHSAGE